MGKQLERILLIRTDRIGDVVLTTPTATMLKSCYPDIHISFLARPYTMPLLQQHRHIDQILAYDPQGVHRGLGGHRRLVAQLREQRFDAAILFYPRPALAAAIRLAGIPLRVGNGYRWYSFLLNQRFYEHRKHGDKHELTHNLTFLTPFLDPEKEAVRFEFALNGELQHWREKYTRETGLKAGYVIIHPGNGGSAPNLSVQQYRDIARFVLENSNRQILFTGSAEERQLIEHIAAPLDASRVRHSAGRLNMSELMAVTAGAALFIATSTGPLHIANAFGIPVLAFYCPSDPCSPRRWGPYDQLAWVLTPDVPPCDHCRPARCPNGNCVEKISAQRIEDMLAKRLGKLG